MEGGNRSILLRPLSRLLSDFQTQNNGEGLILCCCMIGVSEGRLKSGRICSWHRAAAKEPGRWLGSTEIAVQPASTLEVLPEYLLPPVLNHQILIARLQPIQWDSNHHLVVKECPRAPGSWYVGQYLCWTVLVLEYTGVWYTEVFQGLEYHHPGEEPTAKNLYADAVKL